MNPLSPSQSYKTEKLLFVKLFLPPPPPPFLLKIGSVFSQTDQQEKMGKIYVCFFILILGFQGPYLFHSRSLAGLFLFFHFSHMVSLFVLYAPYIVYGVHVWSNMVPHGLHGPVNEVPIQS